MHVSTSWPLVLDGHELSNCRAGGTLKNPYCQKLFAHFPESTGKSLSAACSLNQIQEHRE